MMKAKTTDKSAAPAAVLPAAKPAAAKTRGPYKKRADTTILAYLAVSSTAAARVRTFPVSPGFDESGARKRLDLTLAGTGNWTGFACVTDGKKVAVRRLRKSKD